MCVIGGADGPTVIFVTASPGGVAVLALLAAALGALLWFFLRRRKR